MADFIPGPWTIEPRDDCSGFKLYDADGDLIDYLSETRWIDDRTDPEMVASVHLMASAPSLYETLERSPDPNNFDNWTDFAAAHFEWMQMRNDALSRARGEQVSA